MHQRQAQIQQFQSINEKVEWTPEFEAQVRHIFYVQSARFSKDTAERNQYVDCCISRLRQMFPDSVPNLQGSMPDSLITAITKMGEDCAISFKKEQAIWQPILIEQLKLQFYSFPETKMLPQGAKKEYVDCLALRVVTNSQKDWQASLKIHLKLIC